MKTFTGDSPTIKKVREIFEAMPSVFFGGNDLQHDGKGGYDSSFVHSLWDCFVEAHTQTILVLNDKFTAKFTDQKVYPIFETGKNEDIESNIGLMYGNPNGSQSIDLDISKDVVDFIKEQNKALIISIDDKGLVQLEIDNEYRL